MPQNVLVSVLGEGAYLQPLVRAILKREPIPARNLCLSAKNAAACQAAEGYAARICEDAAAAILNSEIVLVTASRREMPTCLAQISDCTQKRVLVTVCDDARVNLAYVVERIAGATEFVAAVLHKGEGGRFFASYEIADKTRLFLHQPCRDLVDALCEKLNTAG